MESQTDRHRRTWGGLQHRRFHDNQTPTASTCLAVCLCVCVYVCLSLCHVMMPTHTQQPTAWAICSSDQSLKPKVWSDHKILSADFAATSKNSGRYLCCLLKIDITSVIDANENDHTSRRYTVVFFVFVMKFVMICHYYLISMPVSLYITNSWYVTVKYNREVMSFLTDKQSTEVMMTSCHLPLQAQSEHLSWALQRCCILLSASVLGTLWTSTDNAVRCGRLTAAPQIVLQDQPVTRNIDTDI